MRRFSAVVLGAGGVGKSALTVRFVKNTFADGYDPTIEETYRKTMSVDGQLCMLEVLDTAGAEQFSALSEHYIQGAMGYVLVFSLTQASSMREIESLRWQIHRIKGLSPPPGSPTANSPQLPIVIVGTKSDLISEREVSRDLMTQLSQQWGCPFYETSSKNNWNVNEVFEEIVKQMRVKILEPVPKRQSNVQKKKKGSKCTVM